MKLESQVIVDQHATVKMYLDLVHTARHMLGKYFNQKFYFVLMILTFLLVGFNFFYKKKLV